MHLRRGEGSGPRLAWPWFLFASVKVRAWWMDLWIPAFAGMTTKGGKRGNDDQSANGDRREMTTHARMNDRTNN